MRDIEISEYPKNKIINGFKEILESSKACKFSDCNHIKNEGCNVEKDLLNGVRNKYCYQCWDMEDQGSISMRQSMNKTRKHMIPK